MPEEETPDDKSRAVPLTPYTTAPEPQDDELSDMDLKRTRDRTHSISSVLSESHYAVLPHGLSLAGWTEEDKEILNDHVRHLLHSRRAKFKRSMRGFGKYVRRRKLSSQL